MFKMTGIIVPAHWNDSGREVSLAIATHAEDEYRIANLEISGKRKV